VLLTLGRILQGFAVGGEWSGSVLMTGEWSDARRRGFTTSFVQMDAPAGMVLANGALRSWMLSRMNIETVLWPLMRIASRMRHACADDVSNALRRR
jgi:MFS family permease